MLIKQADGHAEELARLERAANTLTGDAAKRAERELKQRKAGMRGESDSAYQIDFHWGQSPNRAIIHDLRVEQNGRVAQIDHLFLNRWMDCYVLESKHFHASVKITEQGEFLRWNDFKRTYEGMESPLEQNERHIAVLKDVMKNLDLPVRLGVRIKPAFHSFVLVSAKSRVDRPKNFDTSRVIKADQIKTSILNDIDKESTLTTLASMAKMVSSNTMCDVAQRLVAQHRPVAWPVPDWMLSRPSAVVEETPRAVAKTTASQTQAAGSQGPTCKKCGGVGGAILYGKYGYYFKCGACGGNTAIRFACLRGHAPKLRKQGNEFFRDCAECGTTKRYFVNAG
ncbi:MAG: nuclease-related domain-containing protein [Rhodanobacteraceae bacterium]